MQTLNRFSILCIQLLDTQSVSNSEWIGNLTLSKIFGTLIMCLVLIIHTGVMLPFE